MCYSNWGLAEKIKRLKIFNSVKDIELNYQFNYANCLNNLSASFDMLKTFITKVKVQVNKISGNVKDVKRILIHFLNRNIYFFH